MFDHAAWTARNMSRSTSIVVTELLHREASPLFRFTDTRSGELHSRGECCFLHVMRPCKERSYGEKLLVSRTEMQIQCRTHISSSKKFKRTHTHPKPQNPIAVEAGFAIVESASTLRWLDTIARQDRVRIGEITSAHMQTSSVISLSIRFLRSAVRSVETVSVPGAR
jgi:hypothetical protein